MSKIRTILLSLLILNSVTFICAEKRKNFASRLFEGTLVYVTDEYHSAAVRAYAGGLADDSYKTTTYTISGDKLHVIDENNCMHTIYDADNNIVYFYSELTNQGVSYPYDRYTKESYCQYSDNSKFNKLIWGKDGTVIYKGDDLITRHADMTSVNNVSDMVGEIEYWYSPVYRFGSVMSAAFAGMSYPGLIKKYIWEQKGNIPSVGAMHSVVAGELVAIREYHVDPSEFEVPIGVSIKPEKIKYNMFTMEETLKMEDKHKKTMQKMGFQKDTQNQIKSLYKIQGEWSFVKNWEEKENSYKNTNTSVWGEIGNAIIASAAEISQAIIDSRPNTIIYPEGISQTGETVGDDYLNEMSSLNSGHSLSKEQYELMYSRIEDKAKGVYDALTKYGAKVKNKKTNEDVHGYGGGTDGWRPQYFNSLKKNLHSYQRMMTHIRNEAKKQGFSIKESEYETINVNY